jgi:hypothetical protein
VRSAAPMVPAALEAVVAKALERDRTKRYATAAEFADSLERASRVVGALGTHKDVAAHLDAVLGTEISQQREAVRAWLSRSEPSRHGMEPPLRPELTGVTRVEGKGEGSGSLPRASAPGMPAAAPVSGVSSVSSPSSPSSASGVSSVSSVTSAVLPPEPVRPLAAPLLPIVAPHQRSRVWPWVLVAAVVVVGGIVLVGRVHPPWLGAAPTAVVPAAPAAPSAGGPVAPVNTPPSTSTAPLASSALGSASASVPTARASAVSASGSTAAAAPVLTRPAWHPGRPVPPPVATAAAPAPPGPTATPQPPAPAPPTATAAPVPDDISRNPYR